MKVKGKQIKDFEYDELIDASIVADVLSARHISADTIVAKSIKAESVKAHTIIIMPTMEREKNGK